MALYYQLSTQNVLTKFLSVSSITGGNSVNSEQLASTVASLVIVTAVPSSIITQEIFTSSVTASSITSQSMSTLVLYASSIIGVTTGGGLATIPSTLSTFSILTSSIQFSTATGDTISAQQLFVSSILGNTVSTIGITAGNITGTNLFVSSATLSTFSTNSINFAGGFGYLTMPDIYPNTVYTSTVTTSNLLVGVNSVISPIQFYGLGNYTNSVVAELSTGATTQELVMFRGSNATDRIRFQTTGSLVFEPGVSARLWPTVPSNVTPAMVINTSSNVGIQTASPGATLDVAGTGRFIVASTQQLFVSSIQSFFVGSQTLSTLNINLSSINGQAYSAGGGGGIATSNLTSTVAGLGQRYLSSFPANLSTSGFFTSSVTASSITTSSLQVNSLVIGTGTGWVNIGPIQTVAMSSIQLNTNDAYINNLYVGIQSTINDIAFNGLFGNYNNTVLAEISTGGGTQELLVFKGSSASDRVRVQTTGNFVIETGVSARLFNSNTLTTLSNATPAFIINSSSNVGIQTASPATTLDVAGTGRFQQLSTLNINFSSINGQLYVPGAVTTLPNIISSFGILTSSVTTSTLTTTQTAYMTSAMLGNNTLVPQTTLDVVGEGTFRYQANLASNAYGTTVDTLILTTPTVGNSNGAVSLMFGTSTVGFPLARIGAFDYGFTTTAGAGLVFQVANASTNATLSGVTTFSYTGSLTNYTVGAGVTSLEVALWGAGGGASGNFVGGPGAFARGTIAVSPGQQLRILVGQGGAYTTAASFGGGGSGGGSGLGSAGGGRTSIQRLLAVAVTGVSGNGTTVTYTTAAAHGLSVGQPVIISNLSPAGYNGSFPITAISTTAPFSFSVANTTTGASSGTAVVYSEVVIVAGGGGAAQDGNGGASVGGYGGLVNGGNGGGALGNGAGYGGTQSNAGIGTGGGTDGSFLQGATLSPGAGGGGGYWGGGGGDSFYGGGGGGGSSYLSNITITSSGQTTSGRIAPGNTDPYYVSGVADGGATAGGTGGNGYAVIIASPSYALTEAMRINSSAFVGIATTTPTVPLDVGATARVQTLQVGTVSTVNTIAYNGLFGNYNNTVLAEISTGAGTQEFLVFKGSSASDRVRVQTTGNFVIETGVSARLFSTTTLNTLSNATPSFIIDVNSNVGIQTASPGATFDVAGTGRFQTLSTLSLRISSINGEIYSGGGGGGITTANLTSSITGLGSAGYLSSFTFVPQFFTF